MRVCGFAEKGLREAKSSTIRRAIVFPMSCVTTEKVGAAMKAWCLRGHSREDPRQFFFLV